MKTQKPEKKILRKMKREYDDFEDTPRKSKDKKPKRGQKTFYDDEDENINENR